MVTQYAAALFDLAVEQAVIEKVKDDFDFMMEMFHKEADLLKILTSPRLKPKAKKAIISQVFLNMHPLMSHFLYVLIDNSRVDHVEKIYEAFNLQLKEYHHVAVFDVYTAQALTPGQMTTLYREFQKRFPKKIIEINESLDPSLIGGIRVTHDGKTIDVTLKKQMQVLKASL